MIIEISVALATLAFIVLVIYLIGIIKALKVSLGQLNHTLAESRKHLNDLATETKKVIKSGNQLSIDIDDKVKAFSPLFRIVENLGEALENKTSSLKGKVIKKEGRNTSLNAGKYFYKDNKENEPVQEITEDSVKILKDVLEITALGIRLWQNIKRGR